MAQFFQRRGRGFQMRTRGTSSSASDSTERVLNRSAAVVSVNRRCRLCFGRFATTLDFQLFQQYRPITVKTLVGTAQRRRVSRPPRARQITSVLAASSMRSSPPTFMGRRNISWGKADILVVAWRGRITMTACQYRQKSPRDRGARIRGHHRQSPDRRRER